MSRVKNILRKLPVGVHQKVLSLQPASGYYHMVKNEEVPYVSPIYPFKNETQFENDLKFIDTYYKAISYQNWLDNVNTKNAFLLTFDDGFRELKTIILPLLEKYQIPAIFFITTDTIDNKNLLGRNVLALILDFLEQISESSFSDYEKNLERIHQRKFENKKEYIDFIKSIYNDDDLMNQIATLFGINVEEILKEQPHLTLNEIEELQNHPLITIGAHSTNHYKYELMTPEEIEKDIIDSSSIIKQITHSDSVPFAFPFHSRGVSDELMLRINEKNPWINGFFGEFKLKNDNPIFVSRLPLDNPEYPLENRIRMESANYLYGQIRR